MTEKEGLLASISFSQRIHAQLVKLWLNAVVVKLLGRSIGYRVPCNGLDTLWSMTEGFSVIDFENNFFLVRFKNEGHAQHSLTQGL